MRSKKRAWAVVLAVFLASIAVAANRFKVPPVMPTLMAGLGVDMVTAGWLMGVSSLAGIVLAIPAAFVVIRLGLKATGLVALSCALIGSMIGVIATTATMLLVGRIVEGISVGLIAVVSPTAISYWFKPHERGLPMGVWAAWIPAGNVIMFNVAHPLLGAFGWQGVWWFGAAFAFVALAIYGLVVTEPPENAAASQPAGTPLETTPALGEVARRVPNLSSWILALAFALFGFCLIGYNTWVPVYLTETLQIAPATASFYASLMFLAAIPGNLAAGWAVDRTSHRHRLLSATFLVTGMLFAWSFGLESVGVVVAYMLLLGFISNLIPTTVFTLAPETMDRLAFAGLGLGIVLAGGNVGSLVGPPALGSVVSRSGWARGSLCLTLVMGAGLMVSLVAWRQSRQREYR